MAQPQPTSFRLSPDDRRRIRDLEDVLGGGKAYIVRLGLARLAREVKDTLATSTPEALRERLAVDIGLVVDPAKGTTARARRRRVARLRRKTSTSKSSAT